ncbi:MAG: hypothetical protein IPG89_01125 [Bacteroidetes bacterium]|nr:hypothetical protein [Bacteroidota bacterium]
MKKLLYILLFTLSSQFCEAQDSVSYFNKTLSKNAVTGTLGGETVFISCGYERCFYSNKTIRFIFSTKIGPSNFGGVAIPTGIIVEGLSGGNKIIGGIYLGNKLDPFAKRYSMNDVREIEKDQDHLKTPVYFFYVPYGALTLGYKRYFNKKNALSVYGNFGVYPTFELYASTPYEYKPRLIVKPLAWGGITYHRQF